MAWPPSNRGAAPPRSSLSATHPSMYTKILNPTATQPPLAGESKGSSVPTGNYVGKRAAPYPTPAPSPKGPAQTIPSNDIRSDATRGDKRLSKSEHQATPKAAVKMPWDRHTDPTLTISDRPPLWSTNHTVLKSDTNLTHGSTISPTWMHGLPCGGMTEVAHYYPSKDSPSPNV